jgi:Ca2+-binding EF-hand superfamily protein
MRTPTLNIISAAFVAALTPGTSWAQDCTTDARRVVDAIYRQVLERPANAEGATAVTQLSSGQTTVRELLRNAAQSREHTQRFMSGTDRRAAVTYAYRHVLGREPDPGGLDAHVRVLETENPSALVDILVDSAEYQQFFSDDTVPGAKLRYCGAEGATSSAGGYRFRSMDRNGNGMIERNEWNGTARSFTVHDWNGDGTLSREEVRLGGRRAGRLAAEEDFDPVGPATWTIRNFRVLDRNRDDRVSSNEWFYAPEYFRRADRDRNGSLTLAEFTGGVDNMDDDRDDSFENLDANNNGRIERSEWHGSADAFQWLDRNRDNALSRLEVVGETTGQRSNGFDSFVSLDYNRNNFLEFPEWRWSRRSFDLYDTNRDGRLTRQEFDAQGGAPTTTAR